MQVRRLADAAEFLATTRALRSADPVRTNVLGSVAQGVVDGRRYDREHWWSVVDDAGDVVGAAIWTPPYRVLVGPMPEVAAEALGRTLRDTDEELAGAIGPADVVTALARGADRSPRVQVREHILVLDSFVPPTDVAGAVRRADRGDLALLTDWLEQFSRDSGSLVPDPAAAAEARVDAAWIWEVAGRPVAFAGHAPLVDTPAAVVARIGPVFTPPAERRQGFGAAVTAAVVAHVLPDVDVVMLFTDAANATSNGVYARLGFRHTADVVDVDLTAHVAPNGAS